MQQSRVEAHLVLYERKRSIAFWLLRASLSLSERSVGFRLGPTRAFLMEDIPINGYYAGQRYSAP